MAKIGGCREFALMKFAQPCKPGGPPGRAPPEPACLSLAWLRMRDGRGAALPLVIGKHRQSTEFARNINYRPPRARRWGATGSSQTAPRSTSLPLAPLNFPPPRRATGVSQMLPRRHRAVRAKIGARPPSTGNPAQVTSLWITMGMTGITPYCKSCFCNFGAEKSAIRRTGAGRCSLP